jgi:sulfur carrier protein
MPVAPGRGRAGSEPGHERSARAAPVETGGRLFEVEVNGDRREVVEGSTVTTLLAELGLDPRMVAIEHNGEILKRATYAGTRLAAGDRLEIVRFVQGGRLSFEQVAAIVPGGQGPLAQLVEQQTLNLRVRGSIPWRLTNGSSAASPLSNTGS